MSAFGRAGPSAQERYESLRDVVGMDPESAHGLTSGGGGSRREGLAMEIDCPRHGEPLWDCGPCVKEGEFIDAVERETFGWQDEDAA